MLTKSHTGLVLQLHTDALGLWYGAAGHRPQIWRGSLYDFVRTDLVRKSQELMILGTPENAELIVTLYYMRVNEGRLPRSVRIGSPHMIGVCGDSMLVRLKAMRDLHCATSLGGWHQLNRKDFLTYAICVEMRREGCTPTARQLVQTHPIWPSLSFVGVIDPRWYSDRKEPNSYANLLNYLGLKGTRNLLDALAAGNRTLTPHERRAKLVTEAWCGKELHCVANSRNYFQRVAAEHKHKMQGLVAASRLFVEMLSDVWRHEMALPGRELFVPEHFFPQAADAEAFRLHWGASLCRKGT